MKVPLLLALFTLIAAVWAGGYQGVLERVMLYYAYEIDQLNPVGERTIGFSCIGQFNVATDTCPGGWNPPRGHNPPNSKSNFNQIIGPLSRLNGNSRQPFARDAGGNPLPFADGINGLDIEQTARNVYPQILAATTNAQYPNGRIINPPAYKMRRGATDNYVKFLSDLGKFVQETADKNNNFNNNRDLFQGFQRANQLVLEARMGDHGQYQIQGIRDRLAGTGIDVKTKTVGGGTNPATGDAWDVVDWKRTIEDGMTDTGRSRQQVTNDVEAAAKDFYTNNNAAAEHKPVIDSTRRTAQRMDHCVI
jgi:hypothetical protein